MRTFLDAASRLHALCFTVVVEKSFGSFFQSVAVSPDVPIRIPFKDLERVGRILHLVVLLIAGLGHAGQDVVWLSDEDEIASSDVHLRAVVKMLGYIASTYVNFNMGHLRAGTTASDDGTLQIEDLAAIPDLVAGVMADVATKWLAAGWSFGSRITVPAPDTASGKSRLLLDWLSRNGSENLGRLVFAVRAEAGGIRVSRIEPKGWR